MYSQEIRCISVPYDLYGSVLVRITSRYKPNVLPTTLRSGKDHLRL